MNCSYYRVFLSPGYLRAPSADHRETLPHDRSLGDLYNASPKIRVALSPKKVGAKNMQNSALFQTTFDFDREYLRNSSRYPKSESVLIESESSRVLRKESVNFGPLTTEYWMWVWTHPNWIFRETIFRRLGGAGPSNFNTHYRLTMAY